MLYLIYWYTSCSYASERINVQVAWEDERGRVFGRTYHESVPDAFLVGAYQHGQMGWRDLSDGCLAAVRFLRALPKSSVMFPRYAFRNHTSIDGLSAQLIAVRTYIRNQLKRHPEMRKEGYTWKCDE